MKLKSVCVYCGSSDKVNSVYRQAARELGRLIAEHGMTLWYGGGSTGLMGELANAALTVGGQVVGVIPEMFYSPQLAHLELTHMEVVPSMHQRKLRLSQVAEAFIALPGGYGTLEEFFEILTWAQIGLHEKPIGLLNTAGYFDPLVAFIERARSEGFIYDEHRALFVCEETPQKLLTSLEHYHLPDNLERWLTREH